jgi:predicted site-specific integrase-resolvase
MEEKVINVDELRELRAGILTPAQAAEILGVAVATLGKWRWTRRYNLPFLKVGRNVMYRTSDIAAFLQPKPKPDAVRRRRRHARRAAEFLRS